MTDKEKLVELLRAARREAFNLCYLLSNCDECQGNGDGKDCRDGYVADHLLANGVTIPKWISVDERLPELIPCNAGTAYSEAVIVWTDNRKAMVAVWDGVDFLCAADYWEAWGEKITHWMPLPPAPKGEHDENNIR